MDIKEILISGGTISVPYKDRQADYISNANISINLGYERQPRIVLDIPCSDTDGGLYFEMVDIDKAIAMFNLLTRRPKNLWYKMPESIMIAVSEGKRVRLDRESDMEYVSSIREKLLNK